MVYNVFASKFNPISLLFLRGQKRDLGIKGAENYVKELSKMS